MCPQQPILHFFCAIVTLNGQFDWSAVGKYVFFSFILQAALLTVGLSVIAQTAGSLIGLLLYFMRRARFGPLRWAANLYIWFFRGTPLLVQILLVYTLLPFLNLTSALRHVNFFPSIGYEQVLMDAFVAALLSLSLNEGAYMAEIVRAGIEAIDVGQMEAAKSLGMTYFLAMRRIVLPQAARTIVPPLGNEFNSMLKSSSLASVIGLNELLGQAQQIAAPQFLELELLIVASFWYLFMTSVWALIQYQIERRLNVSIQDLGPTGGGTYLSRLLGFGRGKRAQAVATAGELGLPADRGAR
jgi:polar amino acid transport system permease protein